MVDTLDTAITTAADFAIFAKGRGSLDTDRIAQIIVDVSGKASIRCDRTFVSTGHTEYLDGCGCSDDLYVQHWPVTSPVTSLKVDSTRNFGTGTDYTEDRVTVDEHGQFVVYTGESGKGRIRKTSGVWPAGVRNIEVQYTAGYSAGSYPAPLVKAVHQQVLYELMGERQGFHGRTAKQTAGGGGLDLVDLYWLPKVADALDEFRRGQLVG